MRHRVIWLIGVVLTALGLLGATPACAIYGGHDIAITEVPWIVGINRAAASGGSSFTCGGVLVDARFVVTAAHCAVENGAVRPASDLTTWMGNANRVAAMNDLTTPRRRVAAIAVPPQYDVATDGATAFDVAVLTLAEPYVPDGTSVRPIPLGTSADEPMPGGDRFMTEAGWGSVTLASYVAGCTLTGTCPSGPPVDLLQGSGRLIVYPGSCGAGFDVFTHLCIRDELSQARSHCKGDSGGPVVAPGISTGGAPVLIGVVSGGYGCGDPTTPNRSITRMSSTDIAAFIHGVTDRPAPAATAPPAVVGTPVDGGQVSCRPATWSDPAVQGTRYWLMNGRTRIGPADPFTPGGVWVGATATCVEVGIRSDGVGGAVDVSSAPVTISPNPHQLTGRVVPALRVARRSCRPAACSLTVVVSGTVTGDGITLTPRVLTRVGRRTLVGRRPAVRATHGVPVTIRLGRITRGSRVVVQVSIRDFAGAKQVVPILVQRASPRR